MNPTQALSLTARHRLIGALGVSIAGMIFYLMMGFLVSLPIHALYGGDPNVFYAPSHFNDARQYVFICTYGYDVPYETLPTLQVSRLNWMPVYAALQCALNRLTGVSLVYTGTVLSTLSIGLAIFLAVLVLVNLGVRYPLMHALVVLIPPIGGAWLYLPGAEAIYLAVGMVVMWLITLPPFGDTPRGLRYELIRALAGLPVGAVFVLTKPNALAMLPALAFAFFYLSWQRSRAAGYTFGLWTFVADVVIAHLPRGKPAPPEPRPVRYDWAPATIAAGILLGLAYWVAYSSLLSGIPFYFLQQQFTAWGRAWFSGNLGDMLRYFAQAFNGATLRSPWRYNAAWNLAANLAVLIPAASPRVPGLIRGMLPLMLVLLLYSGAVHGSDRYVLSTALVAIGWGCWLAPTGSNERWAALRWTFLLVLYAITFYLLVGEMFPRSEPRAWGIVDR